jgi:GNAT superfamily N-acetyltransferase
MPDGTRRITLAEADDRLMGFICAFGGHDPIWGSLIDNLHVHPSAKGKGLGAANP